MSAGNADSGLQRGPMLLIGAIGVIAFVAMLLLGAYAPDFRSGRNGGTHALSTSATGFSGLVRLAEDTGRRPLVVRNQRQFDSEDLLIVSPDSGAAKLDQILKARGGRITLVILPKWRTQADPKHSGWVRSSGLHFRHVPEGVLAPQWKLGVTRHKSTRERLTAHGPAVSPTAGSSRRGLPDDQRQGSRPVLTDARGRIVLAIGQAATLCPRRPV